MRIRLIGSLIVGVGMLLLSYEAAHGQIASYSTMKDLDQNGFTESQFFFNSTKLEKVVVDKIGRAHV